MNDGISHKSYKIWTAYCGWDSEFVWVISNSNIKCSSIYHGSSGINVRILPTRRSGNDVWVGVDWFCNHKVGCNLSLSVINFGSKLLPLPFESILENDLRSYSCRYWSRLARDMFTVHAVILYYLIPSTQPNDLVEFFPLKFSPSFMHPGWRHPHTLFPSTRTSFSMKEHSYISSSNGRGPSLLFSIDMDGWRSHKIRCIFGAIDCIATKNADFEISRAVLEKRDVVLHLNVVWRGVIADVMRT